MQNPTTNFACGVPFDQPVMRFRVETGLGHPGHVLSESTGSDLLYKISRSDPDSATASGADQSDGLSMFHSDDGSVSQE